METKKQVTSGSVIQVGKNGWNESVKNECVKRLKQDKRVIIKHLTNCETPFDEFFNQVSQSMGAGASCKTRGFTVIVNQKHQ